MSVISDREYEEALRDWLGDRVHFRRGWRHRTSAGDFDAHGVVHHWTAMSGRSVSPGAQERLLANGRTGLPGPLAHLSPRRSGIVAVIAGPHANANHAGLGDADVYRAVLTGRFDGSPRPRRDSVDGNARLYGFEYQYHPDDGQMPDEQVEAGILAATALAQAHGWSPEGAAGSNLDHFEWTSRKWDREVQNLANRTRAGVLTALRMKEDDMPSAEEIAKAVWDEFEKREFPAVRGYDENGKPRLGSVKGKNMFRELEESLDRLRKAVSGDADPN